MSKDLDEKSISRNVCVYFPYLKFSSLPPVSHSQGTWGFQSLRLSRWPNDDDPPVVQNRLDDLESFYHVLFWISLQHARHELHPVELHDQLTRLFHHALIIDDMPYSTFIKDSHMTSTISIARAKFQNPPLRKLLLIISMTFAPLYTSPPEDDGLATILLATPSAWNVENHEANIRILNSQEFSNWMELSFIQALKCSADEWGLTEYIHIK